MISIYFYVNFFRTTKFMHDYYRNLIIILCFFQIFKGDAHIPKWLSPGAKNMIRRILDPNPKTRINIDGIKSDDWFMQNYTPAIPNDEKDIYIDDDVFFINEVQ